jgi:DNA replication and repair protein RecF
LKKGQKKVKRNGKAYDKFSDHVGFIPLVIISPADRDLIVEGRVEGSLWIASSLSWTLQHLIQYQKVLNQRNALLKYFALNRVFENDTLAIYNEQLEGVNISSIKERNSYLNLYLSLTTITTRSPDRKKRSSSLRKSFIRK